MARSSFLTSMNFGRASCLDLQNWNGDGGSTLYDWLTQVDAAFNTSTGHYHDGTDSRAVKLGTTSQLTAQIIGTASAGTATVPPHADHRHLILGATTSQIAAVAAASASRGTATAPSRGDHRHAITYGTTSQLATQTGVATKGATANPASIAHIHGWNGVTTSQLAAEILGVAARGTLTIPARGDHRHSLAGGTTSQLGVQVLGAATAGVATVPPHADHVHALAGGTTSQLGAQVIGAAVAGIATVPAHADHVHALGGGTTSQIATIGEANYVGVATVPSRVDHVHMHDVTVEKYLNWAINGPQNGDAWIGGGTTFQNWRPDHTVLLQGWRLAGRVNTTIPEAAVIIDLNVFNGAFTVLDSGIGTTFNPLNFGYTTTIAEGVFVQMRYGAPGTTNQRTVGTGGIGVHGLFAAGPFANNVTLTMIYTDA